MIIDRLKLSIKRSFSNYPKLKFVMYSVAIIVILLILVTIYLRKTIIINVDGNEKSVVTYKSNVNQILEDNEIQLNEKDKISLSPESNVSNNEYITIKKAVPITLKCKDTTIEIESAESTIEDVINSENSTLSDNNIQFDKSTDEVYPNLDSNIESDMEITIVNVETKTIIEQESLDFDTIIENDDSLYKDQKQVKLEGKNGLKEIEYQVVYKNGEEYSKEIINEKVISEPQNKIVIQGTKERVVNRGNSITNVIDELYCEATAYCTGSITASGTSPVRNPDGISTIAVDPSVIPIGTKVYVEGYGYAIAADTGGAIKGHIIDLYLNSESECENWGRRKVKVSIIKYP